MALQLLALVTVNWLFFPKPSKCFTALSTRGTRQGFTPVTKTELPMPLELSRTPIPLRLGVKCCLFMSPSFSIDGTKTVGRCPLNFPRFASPIALDVLLFLFIIFKRLCGAASAPKKALCLRDLCLFVLQSTLIPLHQEVYGGKKKDFLSNLRKNLTKLFTLQRQSCTDIFVCKFVITGLFLRILIKVHAVESISWKYVKALPLARAKPQSVDVFKVSFNK